MTAKRVACVLSALLLVGCGGGGESPAKARAAAGDASPSPTVHRTTFKSFDPPQRFDVDGGGIPLPEDTAPHLVTLVDEVAYITTAEGLLSFDLGTGLPERFIPTQETVAFPSSRRQALTSFTPPVLATVDGQQLVIATFTVVLEGAGTTAARYGAELIAMNTATQKREWSQVVALPLPAGGRTVIPAVSLIGIRNQLMVLSSSSRDADFTIVFDVFGPDLVWTGDFAGSAVVDNTVIGVARERARQTILGYDLAVGTQLWAQPDLGSVTVVQAGVHHALAYSRAYSDGSRRLVLLNAAGDVVVPLSIEAGDNLACADDQAGVVVCSDPDDRTPYLVAIANEGGRVLWELSPRNADRVVPQVTSVWHGAIYGTTDNGPVVLNALTGRDLSRNPGIAPTAVNDRCGIAGELREGVFCYPATR
ncbi:MAG: hypothetical protein ACT4OM_13465 [Actinomycetota bacterium]